MVSSKGCRNACRRKSMMVQQNGHTSVGINKISSCFRLLLNGEEQDFLVVLEFKSRIVCVVHRKSLK